MVRGGQTVYQDLEVDAEMQRGLLPGLLVLGSKLGPTMRSAASRTVAGIAQFAQEAPQRAQETYAAVRSPANSTALTNAHGTFLNSTLAPISSHWVAALLFQLPPWPCSSFW